MGKDKISGGCVDRSFEVGQQLGRDRDDVLVTTFGGIVTVRVSDVDEAMLEIHVSFLQAEELPLP